MDGAISDQVYIDFKRRVQDASLEKVERLVVNSQGGDMFSAMAIGLLVKKNNMDVEVRDICASSCANYIFPSGKRKFLNESSIVGYHGGMLQENMVSQIEQLLKTGRNEIGKQFKEGIASSTDSNPEVLRDLEIPASKTKISKSNYIYLQNYEKKYFAKNHVNQLITIYGQRGIYCATYESKQYDGYYYSIEVMERFGISNIQLLSEFWRPENNKLYNTAYKIENVNENLSKPKRLPLCNIGRN